MYLSRSSAVSKKFKLDNMKAYVYILPISMILICFYFIPLIMSFYFSFTKYNIMSPAEFAGIDNYRQLLGDKVFWESLKNNFIFVIVVVPIQTVLSLLLAIFITTWEGKTIMAKLAKICVFIPVISSMILVGIVWRALLNANTPFTNELFSHLGIQTSSWLGNPKTALPTLMMINIWKNVGFFTVIYIAAIMDISKTYYEAARVDGANKFHEIIHITVPLLKPTTIMVIFLGSVWSFQVFDLVYTLTGGGPGRATMTLVMHIYNLSFKQFNSGYSMAVANVLFFVVALITILQRKFLSKEKSEY